MKDRLAFTGCCLLLSVASFPSAGQTAETDDDELFGDSAVEFFAELELKVEQLDNYALGTWPGDKLRYTEEEITLALFYEKDDLQAFAEITLNGEQWEDLEIDFIAGSFKAGNAFGDATGERTNRLFFRLTYEF